MSQKALDFLKYFYVALFVLSVLLTLANNWWVAPFFIAKVVPIIALVQMFTFLSGLAALILRAIAFGSEDQFVFDGLLIFVVMFLLACFCGFIFFGIMAYFGFVSLTNVFSSAIIVTLLITTVFALLPLERLLD